MKKDVDGGCVCEEGQKDGFLLLLCCLVQGMKQERLPLFHLHLVVIALHPLL